MFLILIGLLAACVGVVLLAWKTGSELYVFSPASRLHLHVSKPPDDPLMVLALFVIPVLLYFYSQHFALIAFSILTADVLLGSVIGFAVYAWTPSILQHLLSVAMVAAAAYGWVQREYFDY
jgi:hypothetical protein